MTPSLAALKTYLGHRLLSGTNTQDAGYAASKIAMHRIRLTDNVTVNKFISAVAALADEDPRLLRRIARAMEKGRGLH